MVNTDIPARGELAGELPLSFNLYTGLLRRERVGVVVTAVFQAPAARQRAVFLRDRQGLDDVDLDEAGPVGGTE